MGSVETDEIVKIEYASNMSFRPLLAIFMGSFITLLPASSVVLGFPLTFMVALIPTFLYLSFRTIPNLTRIAGKNRRISQINNSVYHNRPHEVIDDFLEWEDRDEISMKNPISNDELGSIYYQGVLDDGTIVLTQVNRDIQSLSGERDNDQVLIIPADVFEVYDFENEDLEERRKRNRLNRVKEGLENSQYQEVLESTRNELDRLMDEDKSEEDKLFPEDEIKRSRV